MISKLPNVTTTIFAVMSKMAQEYNAINISQGYPNFGSDPVLIQIVNDAMKAGFNQYAPMPGDPLLRSLIVEKMNKIYGSSYKAETDITITAGATQAIFTAIAATVHQGDEVIVFSPAYDCYEPAIELFGGRPRAVQLQAPDFKPDWGQVEDMINEKTRLIIINSPHNPSGTLLDKADMEALEKIVVENGLYVISDEVYEHIIFDEEEHQSAASFKALAERAFITASFGKTFHNTGWKLGYCVAPSLLMTEFRKVHQYNVFSVNHPIQKALSQYISNPETYGSLGSFYQAKRDLFLDLISGSRFRFKPSKGTYFQLLDYSDISELGDIEFTRWLTREKGLATIPTSVFNRNGADFKQVRVCFAKTDETLRAAAEIINNL